jgi:hypothetical protein
MFDEIDELIDIVDKLNSNKELATNTIEAARSGNFMNAALNKLACPEDWLYDNIFIKEPELRDILIKHNIL